MYPRWDRTYCWDEDMYSLRLEHATPKSAVSHWKNTDRSNSCYPLLADPILTLPRDRCPNVPRSFPNNSEVSIQYGGADADLFSTNHLVRLFTSLARQRQKCRNNRKHQHNPTGGQYQR